MILEAGRGTRCTEYLSIYHFSLPSLTEAKDAFLVFPNSQGWMVFYYVEREESDPTSADVSGK